MGGMILVIHIDAVDMDYSDCLEGSYVILMIFE